MISFVDCAEISLTKLFKHHKVVFWVCITTYDVFYNGRLFCLLLATYRRQLLLCLLFLLGDFESVLMNLVGSHSLLSSILLLLL